MRAKRPVGPLSGPWSGLKGLGGIGGEDVWAKGAGGGPVWAIGAGGGARRVAAGLCGAWAASVGLRAVALLQLVGRPVLPFSSHTALHPRHAALLALYLLLHPHTHTQQHEQHQAPC
jgi:hypothetical protein